ncbi:MAG: M20 family metallopeptidase [Planctomycetaceae bacterium]
MEALDYARELVAFDSVSRVSNAAVSDHVEATLRTLGFETERVKYEDAAGLRKVNVVGRKGLAAAGGLAYFGHTDVVPADDWFDGTPGPFTPVVQDDRLYGRGSCDMKGSLATMFAAAARFDSSRLKHPLYFVATADEEVGFLGAKQVAKRSQLYRELKDGRAAGIIGEPTGLQVVTAHKGSYAIRVVSEGEAAHSSSAAGRNANLAMIPFLDEMLAIHDETENSPAWQDDRFSPPTLSWNIGINDHNPAINVKPARAVCTVYFRPMPGMDVEPLVDRCREAADRCGLSLDVFFEARPFAVDPQSAVVQEMLRIAGAESAQTVCYGTDAAVFSELGRCVVCGPGDIAQAHTRDEWIALDQFERGTELYSRAIEHWCVDGA